MSVVGEIKEALDTKAKLLIPIFLFGLLVLFIPETLAQKFGVEEIRKSYRGYVGIGTLALGSILAVQLVVKGWKWREGRTARRQALRALESLGTREYLYLAYCVSRNRQSIVLRLGDHDGGALAQKGLLQPAKSGEVLAYPFTIPEPVWDHLRNNREVFLLRASQQPDFEKAFDDLDFKMANGWSVFAGGPF
jgi:Super-infection exclusion protein B